MEVTVQRVEPRDHAREGDGPGEERPEVTHEAPRMPIAFVDSHCFSVNLVDVGAKLL